jgi:adenosylcobinamide kinase/adenosylcobinamide-phosphate guanylyltransferase
MAHLTLVVGGVRSGKSRFAEQLAAAHPPVTYLATAQALLPGTDADAELTGRIARHRQRRAAFTPPWQTVEEPWDVAGAVAAHAAAGAVLVECLSLWVTNLLLGGPQCPALTDAAILERVDALAEAARRSSGRVIVVSSEVGCGLLPANALARRFGDLLGDANQRLAAAAAEVYGCMAGIPLRLKPSSPPFSVPGDKSDRE